MKRSEQKTADTWNLEALYPDETLWAEDARRVREQTEAFAKMSADRPADGAGMLSLMERFSDLNRVCEKAYVYASMRSHQDTGNAHYQKMEGESRKLYVGVSAACSWLEPWLLTLDEAALEKWMRGEPELEKYRRFFAEVRRRRAHTLSEDKEEMLSLAGEVGRAPARIFSYLQNADLKFAPAADSEGTQHVLTQSTFTDLERSADRALRRAAFENLYGAYSALGNTFAALYDSAAGSSAYFAAQHGYKSTREAMLDDSAIPLAVYDSLLESVHRALPLMHRYVRLRRRLLGVDELHMYDVYVPIVQPPEKKYTFEEAEAMVLKGLRPMGETYLDILREGFANRWVDRYENEGKRGGAYSGGCYDSYPYVLMNFKGDLNDVFTLAHEMGHSVHSWFSRKHQPYITADYRIFVAEVASTCNEALLIRSLLESSVDEKERLYLINYLLEQFKSTLYRQTMFAEFEKITHEMSESGQSLNAETLCGVYLDLNRKYFGEDMISDPQIAWEWARIPHFYTPFYVYQYATGFSAAMAISGKIWKGEEGIIEKYQRFLSGGSSMDPIDLLKICDVDMTSPEPVDQALGVFEEYLTRMEEETKNM